MKKSTLFYAIGLLLVAASIFLIINSPNSGRNLLIAGGLAFLGFPLNIAGFMMKSKQTISTEIQKAI